MSWAAVVKNHPPAKQPASSKKPAATTKNLPVVEKPGLTGKTQSDNRSAPMLPHAQAHISSRSRGSRLGEARPSPLPAARASALPVARAGPLIAAPSQAPHVGGAPSVPVYPVTVGNDLPLYHAPHAHGGTQPSGKVTKTFSSEASLHSNAERRINAERAAASAQSLAFVKLRLEANVASASAQNIQSGGKMGFDDAAPGTNATLPVYGGK
jgi:hypothetical protein